VQPAAFFLRNLWELRV